MTCSMFCKEQGATTLMSLVAFDFIDNVVSVRTFFSNLLKGEKQARCFLRRTIILAVETLMTIGWRYYLNGETSPDFVYEQNPAGFSEDRFTRVFSVNWVYCLYIYDVFDPRFLAPDWSGGSIDLIDKVTDPRIVIVLALWATFLLCVLALFLGFPSSDSQKQTRRVVLMSVFAFIFLPFLLSSNLLVTVGLMKADRVMYLPLLGFCIMEALVMKTICCGGQDRFFSCSPPITQAQCLAYLLLFVQLFVFCGMVHERNLAWSDRLRLWMTAYRVNGRSDHTLFSVGNELALNKRYIEAEYLLRNVSEPREHGFFNTFVYTVTLYKMGRCEEANKLIDSSMALVEEKRKNPGLRDTESYLNRGESNLLVARGFCAPNILQSAMYMKAALEKDVTNQFAYETGSQVWAQVEQMQKMMEQQQMMQQMQGNMQGGRPNANMFSEQQQNMF